MDYKFIVNNSTGSSAYVYMNKNSSDFTDDMTLIYSDGIINVYKKVWLTGNTSFYFDHIDTSKNVKTFVCDDCYNIVTNCKFNDDDIPVYLTQYS